MSEFGNTGELKVECHASDDLANSKISSTSKDGDERRVTGERLTTLSKASAVIRSLDCLVKPSRLFKTLTSAHLSWSDSSDASFRRLGK
jgi:hypothetical protein